MPVTISVSAQLRSDQRIEVEGQTNLPENARLLVIVEREASGVRWQSRTNVEQGAFSVGPLGPGSGMPDGNYRIIVQLSEAPVQPEQVQQRIGQQGQHLTGELVTVSRHGLGQFASYSQRYLIGREPQGDRKEVRVLERP
ncbi:hypothetical protein R5M92_01615 [Halomonas sp. Bachu 37]|uniref:hypothetical protein n=1 Tax=Halomonas kashgarensis TaxID=3084920 RepID=UPI003217267E